MKQVETEEQRFVRLAKKAAYRKANRDKLNAKAAEYRKANRERCYATTKEWQQKHPERMREIKRKNYLANRERYYIANREFAKANPSKSQEYQRTYYRKNRESILSKISQWHARNPEARQAAGGRRRARMRGSVTGPLSEIKKWIRDVRRKRHVKCHWCGDRTRGTDIHIDHVVPIAKGGSHTIQNLCASCPACNQKKFTKMPEVFNKELAQPLLFT